MHNGEKLAKLHIGLCGERFGGALSHEAHNRKYSTLGGVHNSLVRFRGASFKAADDVGVVSLGKLFPRFGNASEEQREDNAGVSAGAAQHKVCRLLCRFSDSALKALRRVISAHAAHCKTHVYTCIAVGNGEHVKVVYPFLIVVKAAGCADYHIAVQSSGDFHYFVYAFLFANLILTACRMARAGLKATNTQAAKGKYCRLHIRTEL